MSAAVAAFATTEFGSRNRCRALAAFGPRSSICAGGPSLFGPASTTRSFQVSAAPSSVRPIGGQGAVASIRDVLDAVEGGAQRVLAVAACGQMHGTVLIDAGGELVLDSVQLWNDKRPTAEVSAFAAANDVDALWPLTRQSAFGRLARLQAAMDRSPPARSARSRGDAADAEGLHQFPADRAAGHGRIRRLLHLSLRREGQRLEPASGWEARRRSGVAAARSSRGGGHRRGLVRGRRGNRAPLWHAGRRGHERFRCDATWDQASRASIVAPTSLALRR